MRNSFLLEEIEKLCPREKQIMKMRFGLSGKKEMTQKQVADEVGISQSYISRLEKKIMQILKAGMQAPSACNQQPWEFYVVTDKKN